MANDNRDLVPDQPVLSGIFPDIPAVTEDAYDLISNTHETCTFRLQLGAEPRPGFPKDLLIQLEKASEGRLTAVAAFQRLGHEQLPNLVPPTLDVGTTKDAKGRELQYSVTPYFDGTTTLEDVWHDLTQDNQRALSDSVIRAIEELHKLDPQSDNVRQIIHQHAGNIGDGDSSSTWTPIGGPETGYYPNIKQFLVGLCDKTGCNILATVDRITVQSTFDDVVCVELSQSDLDELRKHIVLCTNGRETWYALVAIIDWEMARIYPFAYEFGIKDTLLGSSNLSFSWYALFKKRAAPLLPARECQTKLIRAVRIIGQSKNRTMPRNVGVRFQAKWIEREKVKMASDVTRGWIREDSAVGMRASTRQEDNDLELEVLRELGYV